MNSGSLLITEIFHSLQGETSLMGLPFAFIRLSGCNLRCTYCDTSYAFKGGQMMALEAILKAIEPYQVKHVLITGGEPLLQRHTPDLVRQLAKSGYQVSLETHGEVSIEPVAKEARIIMDIKTPSSGECHNGYEKNLRFLKQTDEVKFVIASEDDYSWAKSIAISGILPTREILFSPALPAPDMPGVFPGVSPQWLASRILEERLPVRFQLQLHKTLWGNHARGV